jgi:phospholipid/cholesterol/gamma-HCH transport system substrate-binding protein
VVRSTSLSGIANRYVSLDVPADAPKGDNIPPGGTLPLSDTVSEVDLDQIFNTLDKRTVKHFKQVIEGFAVAYDGVGKQANGGYRYLNPFLSTARRVFGELNLDQRAFESLIVDTANLTGALAKVAPDISLLVHNTNLALGATARQSQALAASVAKLPAFMRLFNTTGVNLRATLNDLDPLVAASKPVAVKLRPFFSQLRGVAHNGIPTIKALDVAISKPGPNNDLIDLTRLQVPLNKIASGPVFRNGATRRGAFPEAVAALKDGLPQLAFFRPYVTAEGVSGWFDDFGHSGIYDANGGIGRIGTTFNAFSLSGSGLPNLLAPPLTGAQFLNALDTGNLQRCPGANERNPGDNSTPFTDHGTLDCNTSEIPLGP